MTFEKLTELQKQLKPEGLSVLLTRDFDSILIQLASLAQFERLIMVDAENNMGLACVSVVRKSIQAMEFSEQRRPLETLDIPTILAEINRALQDQLGNQALLDRRAIHAATAAFVGILCRK